MSGWVRIWRKLFKHPLFAGKPEWFVAWVWLIANAAWKDTQHRIGATMHDVPRGSLYVTLKQLRREWGWSSIQKVRTFLETLENEGMIVRENSTKKTRISICNYITFQNEELESSTSLAHKKKNIRNKLNRDFRIFEGGKSSAFQYMDPEEQEKYLAQKRKEYGIGEVS